MRMEPFEKPPLTLPAKTMLSERASNVPLEPWVVFERAKKPTC